MTLESDSPFYHAKELKLDLLVFVERVLNIEVIWSGYDFGKTILVTVLKVEWRGLRLEAARPGKKFLKIQRVNEGFNQGQG